MRKSDELRLLEYMTNFELTDFVGFARLVKVDSGSIKQVVTMAAEGNNDVGDFVVDIVEKFSNMNRRDRRYILKLASSVHKENAKIKGSKTNGEN